MHAMHLDGMRKVLWYLQLIPEILIHLLTGRMYYFKSLRLFFLGRKKMLASQRRFSALTKQLQKTLVPVQEIVLSIRQAAAQKVIRRF